MRIAQIGPLYESTPPRLYGGTERVVAYLTDALVANKDAFSWLNHTYSHEFLSCTKVFLTPPAATAVSFSTRSTARADFGS